MNPIALWLLNQAGEKLFNKVTDALAENIGIKEKPLTESRARNLLDDYSQCLEDASRRVIDRLDQDRLATLKSAIDQLKRAPKTISKRETLADAHSKFSVVAHLPEQGQTGGLPNTHLRSIAFLGLAAVHLELQNSKDVIAEDIGAAIYADSATAEQWLGKDIVRKLLTSIPLNQNESPFPPTLETTVGLAAASLEARHVECFYQGPDNRLKHRWWWSGSNWTDEQDLGGILTSAPAAISRRPNHVECFYRGQDNHIWHRWWEGSDWKREYRFEHSVSTSAPATSSLGPDYVECFYRFLCSSRGRYHTLPRI